MMNRLRRASIIALPMLGALTLTAQAQAPGQPAPVTLETLNTMLTNMGYEVKPDGKLMTIVAHGNYDLTINFTQGSPGGEVLAYIYLQRLTPDQQARLNMTALLLADDAGPSYFSLGRSQDDYLLYVQRSMPSAAVSPVSLRATIDNLVKVTTANEVTWNTRLWK